MNTQIISLIKAYEKRMSGCDIDYRITDSIELSQGATLYLFECKAEGIESSAIMHADGTVFVLDDWQCSRPETPDEIEDYHWVRAADGQETVLFDGLPRVF